VRGLPVTCDTAPPYFSLTEAEVGDYRTFCKLFPPLRSEADRQAILAGLADGTIDAIASDHWPHEQDSKRVPFAQAAFGSIGLETLLPLTLRLVRDGVLSLLQALALVTCRPAALLGLPDLGRLALGGPADIVCFDPDASWLADAESFRSKSKNSCFDRELMHGQTRHLIVDGRFVFSRSTPAS
jgi:dihydroorotase